MSSSKIIRKGEDFFPSILLGPLGALPEFAPDTFRPVRLGVEEPEELEPPPEEEEPEELPPTIPEEEALARIAQAHAEGIEEGRRQAEAELAPLAQALEQALAATATLRSQLMHEAEEDLLRLSVLIARTVMLREFACDPGILAGVVRAALELTSEGGEVLVRLNPAEYALVADTPEFQALSGEKPGVVLKGDPAVGRAGCLVESARGTIDAGVDAQLDDILRRLAEAKSERREEASLD